MRLTKLAFFGAVASTAVFSGAVAAQDETDWNGFYAGVFGGYGLDTAVATSSIQSPITIEVNPGSFVTSSGSDSNQRFEALFGGIQAGYNYQVNNFVLGAEASIAIGGFDKTRTSAFAYSFSDGVDFASFATEDSSTFSLDWLTTFSGRLGVDLDGWLVYGKAGLAVADVSSQSASTYVIDSSPGGALVVPNGTYTGSASFSGLRAGAVVGLGVEKKLNETVSLGLEYNYVHLGSVDVPAATALGGILGGGGGTTTFSANLHTVKASLNYHF